MTLLAPVVEALERIVAMTWETWWALVLGFTLSGIVEVFVSEERMTRLLGDDGWREVGLGMLFGAASSSCSYSAVGTSKSLFKKGASGVASLGAFLFASTDLVVELGLVTWVLLGWQFVVGEYLGGVVATLVIAFTFRRAVPERWFEAAHEHLHDVDETTCATCGAAADPRDEATVSLETVGGTKYFCCGGCMRAYRSRTDAETGADAVDWTDKLLTAEGWGVACRETMKEWEMLWRDIAFGFVLAGVIAAFVPEAWWTALFGTGGTFQAVLADVAVGAAIGVVTFMCSVGNIPFALVLWRNGLPFGGVLAFVYADLVIPPLVNAYRRYYGLRMAAVLFGTILLAAVVAGVVVHYVVGGLGLVPPRHRPAGTLSGEYTVTLNLLFTPVFLAQVYVTYGPRRIADACTSLPTRLRRMADDGAAVCREVGDALWVFCLDVAAAVLSVAEALWFVVAALRTLARGLWTVVLAVVDLLRKLAELARRLT